MPELLATARQRKLTKAEAATLAEALQSHEPWLEWSGKREARSFAVDPVALHIHERVSAQAILARVKELMVAVGLEASASIRSGTPSPRSY